MLPSANLTLDTNSVESLVLDNSCKNCLKTVSLNFSNQIDSSTAMYIVAVTLRMPFLNEIGVSSFSTASKDFMIISLLNSCSSSLYAKSPNVLHSYLVTLLYVLYKFPSFNCLWFVWLAPQMFHIL